MNDYIFSNIMPRLERLEAENKKLETRFNSKPNFTIEIESDDVEKLVAAMQKINAAFGGATLTITAKLKEVGADGVQA